MTDDHVASDTEIADFVRANMADGKRLTSDGRHLVACIIDAAHPALSTDESRIRISADPVRIATLEEIAEGSDCSLCRETRESFGPTVALAHGTLDGANMVFPRCKAHAKPGDLWLVQP